MNLKITFGAVGEMRILDWTAMCGGYGESISFSMAAWVAGVWRRGEDGRIDLGRLRRLRW